MPTGQAKPADEYATDQEVVEAIRSLSPAELLRLGRLASYRARALLPFGLGQGSEALLQEAIKRTLSGIRRWRRTKVSFVTHLAKTIRSISSHATEAMKDGTVVAEIGDDGDGHPEGAMLTSHLVDPERAAAAAEQFSRIE